MVKCINDLHGKIKEMSTHNSLNSYISVCPNTRLYKSITCKVIPLQARCGSEGG